VRSGVRSGNESAGSKLWSCCRKTDLAIETPVGSLSFDRRYDGMGGNMGDGSTNNPEQVTYTDNTTIYYPYSDTGTVHSLTGVQERTKGTLVQTQIIIDNGRRKV
jgi:hypothetical protein